MGYVGEISDAQLKQLHAATRSATRSARGHRVRVRQGPARADRAQAAARRLARAADEPDRGQGEPEPGLCGPADARREAPAGLPAGASSTASTSPRRTRTGTRRRARSSPSTRVTARSARSRPTRPTTRTSSRPARRASSRRCSTRAPPRQADFPSLNRAIAGVYPPGSTFKPVTALAAMQEHILSPYNSLQCTGSLVIDGHNVQQLGPEREPGDDAADGDRAVLRHLLLPGGQALLRPARRPRPAAPEVGEDLRLR